jgi:hypothetical protein
MAGAGSVDVSVSTADRNGGRTWSVSFTSTTGDIDTFSTSASGLTGVGAAVAVAETRKGTYKEVQGIELSMPTHVDEIQTVTIDATGGTFDLTFGSSSTTGGALTAPASAADVQAALESLSNIASGSITVTSTTTGDAVEYQITFTGSDVDGDVDQVTATDVSLSGGASTVASAKTQTGTVDWS